MKHNCLDQKGLIPINTSQIPVKAPSPLHTRWQVCCCCSVTKLWLVVTKLSGSLWPPWTAAHQASLSFTISGVCSNSYPLSRWCHPSHLPSSPSPPAFNPSQHQGLSQWVSSSHQTESIGVSASASVLPMNIQSWFPWGLTGLISLQSKGLFKSLLQHHSSKTSILCTQPSLWSNSLHPYVTTGKTVALTLWIGNSNSPTKT